MEWLSYLLVLVCPIMMLFMMKGHGGHKHGQNHNQAAQDIELKMTNLEEENKKLHEKLENLSAFVKKESN
ncbi:MAG: DUF2933 domain-containing protein [Bacillus sp. (in: firmicutes)]